jgi:hypothetical protein
MEQRTMFLVESCSEVRDMHDCPVRDGCRSIEVGFRLRRMLTEDLSPAFSVMLR